MTSVTLVTYLRAGLGLVERVLSNLGCPHYDNIAYLISSKLIIVKKNSRDTSDGRKLRKMKNETNF